MKRLTFPLRKMHKLKPHRSWVSLHTHRKLKLFIFSFFLVGTIPLFFYVRWALGATATWTNGGGDGLWSNCANWSGGTGTGGCPGTNDVATFNGTSTANAAIDASISVKGILISSGYTGTITQNSGFTVTIGASGYSQADGTFTGGDSAITLNNATGSFSLTNGTFSNTSATMSIVKDMTISGGTFNNSGTVKFNSSSFSGGYTQTLSCSGTLPGTFDIAQGTYDTQTFALGSGCNITLATNVSTVGSITNSGTMNATNITMTGASFTQSGTLNLTGTLKFNATNFNGQLTQTLSCTGTLTSSGGVVDIAQSIYDTQIFALSSGCNITLPTNVSTVGTITNNGTINATNITMTGASFTQGGILNLTGTLKFNANNFNGQLTQSLTCNGDLTSSGGVVDIAQSIYNTQIFALSSGCNVTLASSVTTTGSITNNGTINATDITMSSGSFTQNGTFNLTGTLNFHSNDVNHDQTLTCTGNLTSSGGLVNVSQTTQSGLSFTLSSGCTINLQSSITTVGVIVNHGIINGTTISAGDLNDSGTNSNDGTINATTVSFTGGSFTQTGTYNVSGTTTFSGNGVNSNQTLTCTGTFPGTVNIAQTTQSGKSFTLSSGCTINLQSSITTVGGITNNGTINGTTLNLSTIDGTLTNNGTIAATDITTAKGSVVQNGTMNLNGSLTFSGTTGSGTLTCTQPVNGSLVINKTSTGTVTLSSNCTITGNFTRTDGQIVNSASDYTLTIQGNFTESQTDAFGGANLTVVLGGSGNQTVTQNAGTLISPLSVNKSGGTASLSTNFTTSAAATVSAGTFFLNGKVFSTAQTLTVQAGGNLQMIGSEMPTTPTLNSSSTVTFVGNGNSSSDSYNAPSWSYSNFTVNMTDSNDTLNPPGTPFTIGGNFTESGGIFPAPAVFNVAGNFSHTGGTFTNNSGLVNLNGTNQKVYGNTTFYDLTKSASNDTLTFESGKTQTVSHTTTLTGTSGAPLRLFATSPGTQAKFDPQGTRTFSFLNVKDNNNINGTIVSTAGLNINNIGDNTNWDFGGRPTADIHVSGTHFGQGTRITTH